MTPKQVAQQMAVTITWLNDYLQTEQDRANFLTALNGELGIFAADIEKVPVLEKVNELITAVKT